MSDNLKPCPFCGDDAKYFSEIIFGTFVHFVDCQNKCQGESKDKDDAFKKWNTRK